MRVVAVGTGQAIKNAANGDGDVLLVDHVTDWRRTSIRRGRPWHIDRADVMYNDFVVVRPAIRPALPA